MMWTAYTVWEYRLLWMEIHPIEKDYDSTLVDRLPCVEIPPTLDGNTTYSIRSLSSRDKMIPSHALLEAVVQVVKYETYICPCVEQLAGFKSFYCSDHKPAFMHLFKAAVSAQAAASFSLSPTKTPYPQAQQTQWSPGAVSSIVFGCIMVVIGALALWQARLHFHRTPHLDSMPLSRTLRTIITSFLKEDGQRKLGIPIHDVSNDHETLGSIASRAAGAPDQDHDDIQSNVVDDNHATQRLSAMPTAMDITLNVAYRSQRKLDRQRNALVRRHARLDIIKMRIPRAIQLLWQISPFALGR